MKKNKETDKWEYLYKHSKKKGELYASFSEDEAKYFSDNTIRSGVVWDVFNALRDKYPESKIVLYVVIDEKVIKVKYYNPEANPTTTIWYNKEDFLCYAPQKELR